MRIIIFLLSLKLLWNFLLKSLFLKFNSWGLQSKRNSNLGFTFLIVINFLFIVLFIYNLNYIFLFIIYLFGGD